MKDIFRTLCEKSITGCTWRKIDIHLWGIATPVHETNQPISIHASTPTIIFKDWPIGVCYDGHFKTTREVDIWPSVHTLSDIWFSRLVRSVPMSNTTASHIASWFMDSWLTPYGVLTHVLADKTIQFVSRIFETPFAFLETKYFRATAYHVQIAESWNDLVCW